MCVSDRSIIPWPEMDSSSGCALIVRPFLLINNYGFNIIIKGDFVFIIMFTSFL